MNLRPHPFGPNLGPGLSKENEVSVQTISLTGQSVEQVWPELSLPLLLTEKAGVTPGTAAPILWSGSDGQEDSALRTTEGEGRRDLNPCCPS